MTFGNGTTQNFVMNDRLQMQSQELKRGTEVLQKYDYGYGQIDASGNLDVTKNNGQLARIESHIGANKQWTQKFSYDSIGRLDKAEEYRGDTNALSYKQKFDFDRFGNLYRKNASNPTTGQATPIAFAPLEDADISKSTNRFTANTTYDDAGNVTQDTKYRNQNFWYDANGRMYRTSVINQPNQSNAVYDSAGQRAATQVDGVWTFFIYDLSGNKIAEYGGLQATDEGGVKYVLSDWQGSSRAILSNSGYVQARMDYTAFGEEIQTNIGQRTAQGYGTSNTLNQKYALTERDKATGLDHTWFRKLENQAGRWTSPDPYNGSMNLGSPQSFNRYSYVENQPTNFVDPSGLMLIVCRTYDESTVDLANGIVTIRERTECEILFAGGGGVSTNIFPQEPIDVGGGVGPGGGDDPDPNEVKRLIDACLTIVINTSFNLINKIKENKKDAQSLALSLAHGAIESSLDPNAIGRKGEIGLFQLKLSTANSLGLGTFTTNQLKDPATNTQLGTTYLQNLINSFNGNVRTALGAYKQGPSNVEDNGLSKKSQEYADAILGCEKILRGNR